MTTEIVTLGALATELNHHFRSAEQHARSAVEHALEAGRLLTEAKALIDHGGWGRWLEDNFEGSARTARAWMQLHRERDKLETRNGNALPLREALALIAEPKEEAQRRLPADPRTHSMWTAPACDVGTRVWIEPNTREGHVGVVIGDYDQRAGRPPCDCCDRREGWDDGCMVIRGIPKPLPIDLLPRVLDDWMPGWETMEWVVHKFQPTEVPTMMLDRMWFGDRSGPREHLERVIADGLAGLKNARASYRKMIEILTAAGTPENEARDRVIADLDLSSVPAYVEWLEADT